MLNVHSGHTPRRKRLKVKNVTVKVRRAKLYYRALQGKAARIKETVVKTNKGGGSNLVSSFYRGPLVMDITTPPKGVAAGLIPVGDINL